MKILNENGIEKAIDFLGAGEWTIISGEDGPLLGGLTTESAQKLNEIGVKAERVGNLHRLLVEEAPATIGPPTQTPQDDKIINAAEADAKQEGFDINNDQHVKALAAKLMPHLASVLPTKEDVNKALNQLKSMTVENDEFVKNLAAFLKSVKRDAK